MIIVIVVTTINEINLNYMTTIVATVTITVYAIWKPFYFIRDFSDHCNGENKKGTRLDLFI